jgi:hypothetical protein
LRDALELAARTDSLNRHARILVALAEVFELAGDDEQAQEHLASALDLYQRKGNLVEAEQVRTRTRSPVRGSSSGASTF